MKLVTVALALPSGIIIVIEKQLSLQLDSLFSFNRQ